MAKQKHYPPQTLCMLLWHFCAGSVMSPHSLAVIKQSNRFWQSVFILRTSLALKFSSPPPPNPHEELLPHMSTYHGSHT